MDIDAIFKLAEAKGLKPRPWTWKPLQPYNGFTHEQRVLKWKAIHLAIQLGLIPPAENFPCSICSRTFADTPIAYHSEDYSSMSEQYSLCGNCHTILHMRFRNRQSWESLKARFGDGTKWYEELS